MTISSHQPIGKQLQTASVALGLARFQLRTGQTEELQATLDKIHDQLQALRQHLVGDKPITVGRTARPHKVQANEGELLAGYLD